MSLDPREAEAFGNAFGILGRFRRRALAQGWSAEEVNAVIMEAVASDYAHLLQTLAWHVVEPGAGRVEEQK